MFLADLAPVHPTVKLILPCYLGPINLALPVLPPSCGPPPMQQKSRPQQQPRQQPGPCLALWATPRSPGQLQAAPAQKGSSPLAHGWSRTSSLGEDKEV